MVLAVAAAEETALWGSSIKIASGTMHSGCHDWEVCQADCLLIHLIFHIFIIASEGCCLCVRLIRYGVRSRNCYYFLWTPKALIYTRNAPVSFAKILLNAAIAVNTM